MASVGQKASMSLAPLVRLVSIDDSTWVLRSLTPESPRLVRPRLLGRFAA